MNVLIKVFKVCFRQSVCMGVYVLVYRGSVDDWDVYFDVMTWFWGVEIMLEMIGGPTDWSGRKFENFPVATGSNTYIATGSGNPWSVKILPGATGSNMYIDIATGNRRSVGQFVYWLPVAVCYIATSSKSVFCRIFMRDLGVL